MPHDSIPNSKLHRIEQDARRSSARFDAHPEWQISRFGYDHGSLTCWDQAGKQHLLMAAEGDILKSNATRAVWQLSPAITQELVRGYRIARAAGLLDDGDAPIPAVRDHLNAVDAAKIAEAIKRDDRQPGGLGRHRR